MYSPAFSMPNVHATAWRALLRVGRDAQDVASGHGDPEDDGAPENVMVIVLEVVPMIRWGLADHHSQPGCDHRRGRRCTRNGDERNCLVELKRGLDVHALRYAKWHRRVGLMSRLDLSTRHTFILETAPTPTGSRATHAGSRDPERSPRRRIG
jgi:hypothetical protein